MFINSKKILLLGLITFTTSYARNIDNLPSYQGFRGVVNTPTAEIQNEGEFEFLYTNQVENLKPSSNVDFRNNKEEENYFINMGVLPNLDATLRYSYGTSLKNKTKVNSSYSTYLKDHDVYLSDRIINLKYQIPFIPKNILKLAIGTQDLGGGASHLNSTYAVMSKTFQDFRTSLGYAQGDDTGALDGVFGSLEYQPFDWLLLGTEYDTKEWNGVIKANYNTKVDNQKINIGLMAKGSSDYKDIYFAMYANSSFNKEGAKAWNKFYTTSDTLKPMITIEPDVILIDGSEYGHMDYTAALNSELSIHLFKNTIISGQYNIPLGQTDNFKKDGIFSYRNRHKTSSNVDQILLSQLIEVDTSHPWVNLIQVGRFDKELEGVSFESGINSSNRKHRIVLKLAHLEDDLFNEMDLYIDEKREEKLLSYQYHLNDMNSNIKLTGGEFLYGDKGVMLGLKRYFSNISVAFDLAYSKHDHKGTNKIGRLTLSMPFGTTKQLKSKYIDIQTGDITYIRKKTLATEGKSSPAQPHHLKEVDNHFTLENYYLSKEHF